MSDVDEALLLRLLKERDQLLAQYPELRPLQNEIDQELSQVKSEPGHRLKRMFELMSDILENELNPELKNLKEKVDQTLSENKAQKSHKRRLG
jgi:hypothetical protein